MLFNKKSSKVLVLCLLAWSATVSAGGNTVARTLVEIDNLCVIANQMERDYAIVGMGIAQKSSAERLNVYEQRFRDQMAEVEKADLSSALHDEVMALAKADANILQLVKEPPQQSKMKKLDTEVINFSAICVNVANDIKATIKNADTNDVLLLGKYNIDVQHLAAMYMMRAWGVAYNDYKEKADELLKNTTSIISRLDSSAQLGTYSKQRLSTIQNQFKLLEFMAVRDTNRFVPALLNSKADIIINEINNVLDKEISTLKVLDQNEFHEVKKC